VAEPISIAHLTKTYPGGADPALCDVSLDVAPGTFLVLLGPSGSGKTTMLRCLAGIERVSSGLITIGDRTVTDGRRHVPPDERDLSMVFQDYALWPHMTAVDNVGFALRRRRLGKADCRSRALAMLERVGLEDFAARYPNELSGGQQQRVALARALIAEPGLVLCDEPLSNLDADLRERMRVEISSLVREAAATTVYITHDQSEAFALADQVGVLEQGRLVQLGTPEDVYNHPATPFVARFTGLAGELRVRVAALGDDGTVEVTAASGTFPPLRPIAGADGSADGSAAPRHGAEAVLAIRPTGVYLADTEDGEHHLSGRVTDVAFRGRGYELAIDVAGHGRLTGVFARKRFGRGERIRLRLEPAGCHLFLAADVCGGSRPASGNLAGIAGALTSGK
jgi:iron(III) transport system ATP-binding protein